MSVTVMARYKGGTQEEVTPLAKKVKAIHQKHGAELYRIGKFHTGPYIGEWLVVVRYADWAAYAKAQDSLAGDTEYQQILAQVAKFAQMTSRNFVVGLDV
jgi:hypothetical protein